MVTSILVHLNNKLISDHNDDNVGCLYKFDLISEANVLNEFAGLNHGGSIQRVPDLSDSLLSI